MRRQALAEDPQHRARRVAGDVVIARDVLAVPPAGLDALRAVEQLQRGGCPGSRRCGACSSHNGRRPAAPEAADGAPGASRAWAVAGRQARFGGLPGTLGAVFRHQAERVDRAGPEPRRAAARPARTTRAPRHRRVRRHATASSLRAASGCSSPERSSITTTGAGNASRARCSPSKAPKRAAANSGAASRSSSGVARGLPSQGSGRWRSRRRSSSTAAWRERRKPSRSASSGSRWRRIASWCSSSNDGSQRPRKASRADERPAQVGPAADQAVEVLERAATEAAREPGARQSQRFAERAHAHRLEPRAGRRRPAQHRQRQRRERTDQPLVAGDRERAAGARQRQCGQRRRREREPRLDAERAHSAPAPPRTTPPRRRTGPRLPRTSSSTPSGGSRLTRGVNANPPRPAAPAARARDAAGAAAHRARAPSPAPPRGSSPAARRDPARRRRPPRPVASRPACRRRRAAARAPVAALAPAATRRACRGAGAGLQRRDDETAEVQRNPGFGRCGREPELALDQLQARRDDGRGDGVAVAGEAGTASSSTPPRGDGGRRPPRTPRGAACDEGTPVGGGAITPRHRRLPSGCRSAHACRRGSSAGAASHRLRRARRARAARRAKTRVRVVRARNRKPGVRPRPAASCRRRRLRGCARRTQASASSQAPESSACSIAHSGVSVRTTSCRSTRTPCAASAGA